MRTSETGGEHVAIWTGRATWYVSLTVERFVDGVLPLGIIGHVPSTENKPRS